MKSNRSNLRFFTAPLPLFVALTGVLAGRIPSLAANANAPAAIQHYNLGADKVALGGYDTVSYFAKNQALKGSKEIGAQHRGVTYYFASEENRKLFTESPEKYLSAYGGWCAT